MIHIPPLKLRSINSKMSGFAIEEDWFVGRKVILWTPLKKAEIRDDSVLYNDGCIKDCMEKNLEDDVDVTPVIAPEKDSIIAPPSTPPGNDLNIAVESGSSWIDYIGPLTSDEIDSDKRWSYRDPNGNIHGVVSLIGATTFVERIIFLAISDLSYYGQR
ncbi:hypothetical protein Tco_1052304 [Tanacetum coccineum]